jgi:hypothetical protein
MSFLFKKIKLFKWELPLIVLLWFSFAFIASVLQVLRHGYNDYLIFKGVFWHLWEQKNLFAEYPHEYFDSNHYGPVFSMLIAPFSILPTWIGAIIWALLQAWILLFAIRRLPVSEKQQLIIVAIAAIDMMTATHNLEFNSMLTAWMILSFVLVEKENDFWATFFIAAGFLVKLYGIGGILFFAFSKHRLKFVLSFLFWLVILFCLPMLFSSPRFIIQSYYDWYDSLIVKNTKNISLVLSGGWQDISVMGLIRRVFNIALDNLSVLLPAAALIAIPLLRFRHYLSLQFRLSYLAIVLISVVIFSTASESPTYVIAMTGVGIWYVLNMKQHSKEALVLLILALVLTSLSSTEFMPKLAKAYIRAHSLKALPCFLVWLWLIADVFFKRFLEQENKYQLYEAY